MAEKWKGHFFRWRAQNSNTGGCFRVSYGNCGCIFHRKLYVPIENFCRFDSFTAPLDVKEPSRWVNNIQDQDLKAGDNITILCKADGLPLPKVTWKKKSDGESEIVTTVDDQQQSPEPVNCC
ncbi:hypothetical protein CEXT_365641 [Caerostris extrusa]|uniref:Ig-like domain-containing protein n=1 Tax=Caerostris extrusa TaxID=172846 RepID=A0AAV4Q4S8_CAEEX|nr:hypothetical protein CEXT_365641 [Caerostris extrusa]